MRIAAVSHVVPNERITNDWVIRQIHASAGAHLADNELATLEHRLAGFFESAGTKVRYRLAPGENAIDLVADAGRRAIADAGVDVDDVEFVIYAGVARGWLEPAMATIVQDQLRLRHATGFDILDACASWLRALHLVDAYLRAGTYRCGLIVNCECGSPVYDTWDAGSLEDFERRFASWTIGEAATVTVVCQGDANDDPFYFRFKTVPEHFDLCLFPLVDLTRWLPAGRRGDYPPMRLQTRSRELLTVATRELVDLFLNDPVLSSARYDVGFGHAASERVSEAVIRMLGLSRERYYQTHGRFGNTVSASVPLGMSLALSEGKLHRGDRVLAVVGASGVTVGLASFVF